VQARWQYPVAITGFHCATWRGAIVKVLDGHNGVTYPDMLNERGAHGDDAIGSSIGSNDEEERGDDAGQEPEDDA
jgi:hypothetical protein